MSYLFRHIRTSSAFVRRFSSTSNNETKFVVPYIQGTAKVGQNLLWMTKHRTIIQDVKGNKVFAPTGEVVEKDSLFAILDTGELKFTYRTPCKGYFTCIPSIPNHEFHVGEVFASFVPK